MWIVITNTLPHHKTYFDMETWLNTISMFCLWWFSCYYFHEYQMIWKHIQNKPFILPWYFGLWAVVWFFIFFLTFEKVKDSQCWPSHSLGFLQQNQHCVRSLTFCLSQCLWTLSKLEAKWSEKTCQLNLDLWQTAYRQS